VRSIDNRTRSLGLVLSHPLPRFLIIIALDPWGRPVFGAGRCNDTDGESDDDACNSDNDDDGKNDNDCQVDGREGEPADVPARLGRLPGLLRI
jgi:hypothetical protein